jgi:hypothetical protein
MQRVIIPSQLCVSLYSIALKLGAKAAQAVNGLRVRLKCLPKLTKQKAGVTLREETTKISDELDKAEVAHQVR